MRNSILVPLTSTSTALWLALAPPTSAQEFAAHHMFVTSKDTGQILEFDASGAFLRTFGDPNIDQPQSLCFGPNGLLYVASFLEERVYEFNGAGQKTRDFPLPGPALFLDAIAFGPDGCLYAHARIQKRLFRIDVSFDPPQDKGAIDLEVQDFGNDFTFGPNGNIFVASSTGARMFELAPDGEQVHLFSGIAELSSAGQLVFGPGGDLWVSAVDEGGVLRMNTSGQKVALLAPPGAAQPGGLAFGPNGSLYVCMAGTNEVFELDALDGTVRAVHGTDVAELTKPGAIAFAPQRLQCRIRGTFQIEGAPPAEIDEKAVLSIAPGSRTLLLDVSKSTLLRGALGANGAAFSGFEVDASQKERLFDGLELEAPAGLDVTRIALSVRGSQKGGHFQPRKATGQLSASNFLLSLIATIKTQKRLN